MKWPEYAAECLSIRLKIKKGTWRTVSNFGQYIESDGSWKVLARNPEYAVLSRNSCLQLSFTAYQEKGSYFVFVFHFNLQILKVDIVKSLIKVNGYSSYFIEFDDLCFIEFDAFYISVNVICVWSQNTLATMSGLGRQGRVIVYFTFQCLNLMRKQSENTVPSFFIISRSFLCFIFFRSCLLTYVQPWYFLF